MIFSGIFATVAAAKAGQAGQAAAGLAVGGAFDMVGVILYAVIAAIAGAIGGALYVVVTRRNTATADYASNHATPRP